jgi:hypothetical protein
MRSLIADWSDRRGDLLAQVFEADEGHFVWEVYRIDPKEDEPHHLFLDAFLAAADRVKVGHGYASCLSLALMRATSFMDGYEASAD